MLVRTWRNGTATLKNSMIVSYKTYRAKPRSQREEPKIVENHSQGAELGPNHELVTCPAGFYDFNGLVTSYCLPLLNGYVFIGSCSLHVTPPYFGYVWGR